VWLYTIARHILTNNDPKTEKITNTYCGGDKVLVLVYKCSGAREREGERGREGGRESKCVRERERGRGRERWIERERRKREREGPRARERERERERDRES